MFAFGVSLFVAKVFDYPWNRPDLSEQGYKLLSGENGVNAHLFWQQYSDRPITADFKNLIGMML